MKRLIWALVMAWAVSVQAAPPGTTDTLVAVEVNGEAVSAAEDMWEGNGHWFTPEQWKRFGVVVRGHQGEWISAEQLGVTATLDPTTQTIRLAVPSSLLPLQVLGSQRERVTRVDAQPRGVFINYDLAGRWEQSGAWGVSVGHDARLGLGRGTLVTSGQFNVTPEGARYLRGATTWHRDFLDRGVSLAVGDVFTPRSTLTSPVNLAGVRIGTDRALMGGSWSSVPNLGGLADTRSTVEIYIDQQRVGTYQVGAGPFEITDYPLIQGAGDLSVVVRDEFGRERRSSDAIYFDRDNLPRGRTEWDVAVGLVREERSGSRYSTPALTAQVVHGVNDRWTTGASVQATPDARQLSVTQRVILGNNGALALDLSASSSPKGSGHAAAIGYEYQTRQWSLRANHTRFSENYWHLGQEVGDAALGDWRVASTTSIGAAFTPRNKPWTVSANLVDVQFHGRDPARRLDLSGRWRKGANDVAVSVSHDMAQGGTGVYATWRHTFGNNRSLSTSVARSPDLVVSTQLDGRSPWQDREVSWSVGAAHRENGDSSLYANADTRFENGDLNVQARLQSGASMLAGRWQGSVWMGEGGVAWQGPSPDSFLVVEVPGQEGVPVSAGGAFRTKTNKNGIAVVPGAAGLMTQDVRIDTTGLPLEIQVTHNAAEAIPTRRGGAKVTFEVATEHLVELRVQRDGVDVLPPARLVTVDETVAVGHGGVAVLQKAFPGQYITLEDLAGACTLRLPDTLPGFDEVLTLNCETTS